VTTKSLLFALRLTVPSAIGIIALAHSAISILYGHGQFTEVSVQRTADIMKIFAIGLPAYATAKIVSSIMFASKDSRTPVTAGIISIVSNIILNAILISPLQEFGLAIATTISGFINAYIMLKGFGNSIFSQRQVIIDLAKIMASSLIMFGAMEALNMMLSFDYPKVIGELIRVTVGVFVGSSLYMMALVALRDRAACSLVRKCGIRRFLRLLNCNRLDSL
jgi:putative peptidoglycan lipid II flippase